MLKVWIGNLCVEGGTCKMQLQICGEDYRFVCSVWWGHRRSFNQSTSLPPVSLALEAGISSFSYLEILLAFCFFVCSKLPAKRNYFNNALISLDSLRGFSQRLFASFKTNLDLVVDYRNFYWNSLPIIPWANCILQFKRSSSDFEAKVLGGGEFKFSAHKQRIKFKLQ